MGLIVNGTPPTVIKVVKDGITTDLTKLQTKDAQALIEVRWGKPYTLTIDAGEHSTITVTRTESLYQNAPLEILQDGSLIHNGDQIRINVSVDSGYKLTKLLYCTQVIILGEESWNEVEISDGYTTSSATTSINGTFNTNVKIISLVEQSASWKTVWTGSFYMSYPGQSKITTLSNPTAPTRVSGSAYFDIEYDSASTNFFNKELPYNIYLEDDSAANYIIGNITLNNSGDVIMNIVDIVSDSFNEIYITKIEQYY